MNDHPSIYPDVQALAQRRQAQLPLFGLGRLVATPTALSMLQAAQCNPARLLRRHQLGDWCDAGALCADDQAANDHALLSGGRLLSVYLVAGERLYVITEAVDEDSGQRASTCILLPSEY